MTNICHIADKPYGSKRHGFYQDSLIIARRMEYDFDIRVTPEEPVWQNTESCHRVGPCHVDAQGASALLDGINDLLEQHFPSMGDFYVTVSMMGEIRIDIDREANHEVKQDYCFGTARLK